ncbi:MAG TPA: 16S rRNA (cytidine(1402)-2'-O)-methyltransferase [Candidatus Acidoferrales bacterium]
MPHRSQPGTLYLVATPIGNLEDITLRALRVLREVAVIACEDTRHTQKLLNHFEIRTRTVSYHQHNERTRARELVERLAAGESVALVSDAGTPLVSDPGQHLVAECVARGIAVAPVPGPAAFVAALAASGLSCEEFLFAGFLPARKVERRRALERVAREPRPVIFYEAPHRIAGALAEAAEVLGNRQAVLARELTKVHEEFLRGTLAELAEQARLTPLRGEITWIVAPVAPGEAPPAAAISGSLGERVEELMRTKALDQKAALKQAARERGMSRRDAYAVLLKEKGQKE